MLEPLRVTLGIIDKMIARGSLAAVLLALSACRTATPAGQSPVRWNPGEYLFDGVYSYRTDSVLDERTEQRPFSGRVRIGLNGPINMESDHGPCGAPGPRFVEQDQERDTRTFRCGAALVTFSRRRTAVEVNATVDVIETIRRVDGCAVVEVEKGRELCRQPSYIAEARPVSRSVRISNVRREGR